MELNASGWAKVLKGVGADGTEAVESVVVSDENVSGRGGGR
jgi:hypothetical protein